MDLAMQALSMTRAQFCSRYKCFFLCSDRAPARPSGPQATQLFSQESTGPDAELPTGNNPLLVAPLVKVQSHFPSMITIGRTQNNDIVVPEKSISKFHAYFRVDRGLVEVADAQSRNGTFLGERRLEPKQLAPLKAGEHVRFARLTFQLRDAVGAWDWIVRTQDQWG
jgi:pSer/pThr/pTyr-binding forkhead associated (FHA) protein